MIRILFVCSRNKLRSPTAEVIFSTRKGVEALSAGTSPDAETEVSADLIEWADLIFVMGRIHLKKLNQRFGSQLRDKRIIVLGIPDDYRYMDPSLILLLESKVVPYLTMA
jgi:predicted protein tyrosine phosphatase